MKIGVMSDSHDNVPNIRKALALFTAEGAEALVHCGDIVAPFSVREILAFKGAAYGVFGNNDGEVAGIKKIWKHIFHGPFLFELGGLRILVCHDETELDRAPYKEIDVRIFGHDHKPEVREGRPLEINPGETGGWLTGRATCAILDTAGPRARILEIK
jgi:putative phosphoesterase